MSAMTREAIEALDNADSLASYREKFVMPPDTIYLDGNSLGALPVATIERMNCVISKEWGEGLIRSWNTADCVNAPRRIGAKIAKLIGATDDEVIVSDSTSVNTFKLVSAALDLDVNRRKILTERGNFPTDHYILQGIGRFLGERVEVVALERSEIAAAIDEKTLLVVLTHVHYKTGEMFDMRRLTDLAHQHGAYILWDLCHSAGAMPVDLNGCNADLAVGCGYKYLNGGPGAPAYTFVAKRLQSQVTQPLTGWFGHKSPFDFSEDYIAAPGIDQFQVGTPSILGLSALETGIDMFKSVDLTALRQKSLALSNLFIELVEQRCANFGFHLASPRNDDMRGSQVSFRHENGYAIMQALIAEGVIGDFRAPDIVRFGFAPLYLRYIDIWNAVDILNEIMTTEAWQNPKFQTRQSVT
jgi:kynureninase